MEWQSDMYRWLCCTSKMQGKSEIISIYTYGVILQFSSAIYMIYKHQHGAWDARDQRYFVFLWSNSRIYHIGFAVLAKCSESQGTLPAIDTKNHIIALLLDKTCCALTKALPDARDQRYFVFLWSNSRIYHIGFAVLAKCSEIQRTLLLTQSELYFKYC